MLETSISGLRGARRAQSPEDSLHEPERRTPMRLDGNYFASSRIGVRRSDQVHGPNAPPKLEVEASHEPARRTPAWLDGSAGPGRAGARRSEFMAPPSPHSRTGARTRSAPCPDG